MGNIKVLPEITFDFDSIKEINLLHALFDL